MIRIILFAVLNSILGQSIYGLPMYYQKADVIIGDVEYTQKYDQDIEILINNTTISNDIFNMRYQFIIQVKINGQAYVIDEYLENNGEYTNYKLSEILCNPMDSNHWLITIVYFSNAPRGAPILYQRYLLNYHDKLLYYYKFGQFSNGPAQSGPILGVIKLEKNRYLSLCYAEEVDSKYINDKSTINGIFYSPHNMVIDIGESDTIDNAEFAFVHKSEMIYLKYKASTNSNTVCNLVRGDPLVIISENNGYVRLRNIICKWYYIYSIKEKKFGWLISYALGRGKEISFPKSNQ